MMTEVVSSEITMMAVVERRKFLLSFQSLETYSTKVKRDHLGKVRTEKRNDINALNKESRN